MNKLSKPLFAGVLSVMVIGALVWATGAKNTTPAADTKLPEPTAEQKAEYLSAYGWMVGQQAGFEMGFSSDEIDSIIKGIRDAAEGKDAPDNMKEIFPAMQSYLSGKEDAYRAKMEEDMQQQAKVHLKQGEQFLAKIANEEGIQKTDDGLYYKIEDAGNDKHPTDDDAVTLHYTGKLIDGTVFDSSLDRNEPVDLPLFGVIPGFQEGLKLIGEGGKATLYIPAKLAYGNRTAGPIPPGSTLVFEVNLLKVHPASDNAETPAEDQTNTEPSSH